MKNIGIICEYNPFHAGHAHLLTTVRGEGVVICLMSGYFTQRGEAAILPPHARAEMALLHGADLVLELPYPYCAASARYFATAGVRALMGVGADTLAFGSECANEAALLSAAEATLSDDFLEKVANGAKNKGDAALFFEALGKDRIGPNDILALEYARAVHARGDKMALYPVLRVGAGYHDTKLGEGFPSATALRAKLARGEDISDDLPKGADEIFRRAIERGLAPADTAALGAPMLACLRTMAAKSPVTGEENAKFADCGGGLLERLCRAAWDATDYESLCRAAATKKYTDGRIRRALLYVLSGVTRADLTAPPAYLRLLGANERGREFLSKTRKTRTVPVVTKPADIVALGARAERARQLETVAQGLYSLTLPSACAPSGLATQPPLML